MSAHRSRDVAIWVWPRQPGLLRLLIAWLACSPTLEEAAGRLGLLDVHRRTAFTFDHGGRMTHESAPNRSRGNRFSYTGCSDGNRGVIRDDVPEEGVADALQTLLAGEPPLDRPDSTPRHRAEYARLLDSVALLGLLWVFPAPIGYQGGVRLVWSGSDEAEALLARPERNAAFGSRGSGLARTEAWWEPSCLALVGGEAVSIATTARAGAEGAEVGVDTAPEFRGRGLATAVVAGWSRHPDLADRVLFYSTGRDNISSRRVSDRLELRFVGSTFAVP